MKINEKENNDSSRGDHRPTAHFKITLSVITPELQGTVISKML